MKIREAEKVVELMSDLNSIEEIERTMEKEEQHWWGFITPDTKRWDADGIRMPETLRLEFVEAVKRAKNKINEEIASI